MSFFLVLRPWTKCLEQWGNVVVPPNVDRDEAQLNLCHSVVAPLLHLLNTLVQSRFTARTARGRPQISWRFEQPEWGWGAEKESNSNARSSVLKDDNAASTFWPKL
jgi:hypothetical protein